MARLKKQIDAVIGKDKQKKMHQKDISLPEYGEYGQIVRKPIRIPNWLVLLSTIILASILIIYVPSFFAGSGKGINNYIIFPDSNMIRSANEYLKDNPNGDFDGDGLLNAQETQKGTDPRHVDTDKDGLSDYYELYSSGTSPTSINNDIVSHVKMQAAEEGKNVNTPYKVNDVVMWPADWSSRAKGSVVKTVNGYRFCNFKGYAQFPSGYAYRVEDGVHIPLNYRKIENAYEITGDYEVLLYNKIIPTKYELSFLSNKCYLDNEGFLSVIGKILDIILPAHSPFIACRRITTEDVDNNPEILVQLKPQWLSQDYPDDRFGRNRTELSDLAQVYAHLNGGECGLVSIFVMNEGEAVFEVYGYDSNGALLLADPDTLKPVGVLNIVEKVSRIMMNDGNIIRREWFSFNGCGFDSSKKSSRICFFNFGTAEEPSIQEPEVVETPEPTIEPTPAPTDTAAPELTSELEAEEHAEPVDGEQIEEAENATNE